jgi:glutamate racemase
MQPIGIFDSGVGGLGIMQAVASLLPKEDIVYVADNKNLPFGEKTPEQLELITEKIVSYLIKEHKVKLVVAACNAATVSSIASLRSKFSVPFVGVVPVVKPTCEKTQTKYVVLLSTPTTNRSVYLKDLIEKFSNGVHVITIPCAGLADTIESGMAGTIEMGEYLKNILAPALTYPIDMVGLCCTHYPFVHDQIKAIVGPSVTIIDSNIPVARQVKRVLEIMPDGITEELHKSQYRFYVTKDPEKFERVAGQLIGADLVKQVEFVVL